MRTAERLDLLEGAALAAVRGWYALPLAVAAAFLVAVLERPRLAAAIATVVGIAAICFARVVQDGPLPADGGGTIAAVGGTFALVGASLTVWQTRRRQWTPR